MAEFAARYNDGRTARTYDARVRLTPGGLEIYNDAGALLDRWDGDALHAVDKPSPRRKLRLARGENDLARLSFADLEAGPTVLARFPNALRRQKLSAPMIKRIALWSAVAAASLAFVVWIVIPAAAGQLAKIIPQQVQSRVGEKVSDQLVQIVALMEKKRPEQLICTGDKGRAALDALVARLAAKTGGQTFHVRVVDTPMVNAVAMPGGHILVTSGILKFVDGPNELAGVLAHEMGHVVLNHSAENLIKVGGVSALFSLLVGDVAGGAVIIAVANSLVQGSFSQEAERAADDFAVDLMKRAGLDAKPLSKFFDKLAAQEKEMGVEREGGIMEWMASHPPTQARATAVREAAAAGDTALTDAQWLALQGICK